MVRICPSCSNVDSSMLEGIVPSGKLTVECIGECGQHEGKSFGYINDELVIKDSQDEFIAAVKAANK